MPGAIKRSARQELWPLAKGYHFFKTMVWKDGSWGINTSLLLSDFLLGTYTDQTHRTRKPRRYSAEVSLPMAEGRAMGMENRSGKPTTLLSMHVALTKVILATAVSEWLTYQQ